MPLTALVHRGWISRRLSHIIRSYPGSCTCALTLIVGMSSLPPSHPDKVKLGINETMEMVEAKFVEITKAYKS